jgi:hypothetical protein
MNANNKIISSLSLIICLAITACNLPSGAATETPGGEASPTFTPIALDTASPTPAPVATATQCSPMITTNTDSNVRSGPGQVYNILGQIPQGGTAPVAGKNFEGTWWYIVFAGGPGGFGWIAGSITTATCIPGALAVIAAPPTPVIPPTNTPVPPSAVPPSAVPPSATPVPTAVPTIYIPTIVIPCIDIPPIFFCP